MTELIDGRKYISAGEAAEMLATTPLRILMLLREKRLAGLMVDDRWHLSLDSVEEYARSGNQHIPTHGCRSCGSGCRTRQQ